MVHRFVADEIHRDLLQSNAISEEAASETVWAHPIM
jgi:hypothetical protein